MNVVNGKNQIIIVDDDDDIFTFGKEHLKNPDKTVDFLNCLNDEAMVMLLELYLANNNTDY